MNDQLLAPAGELTPGIPGFSYADLYRPERLGDLLRVFDEAVAGEDPVLSRDFGAYRACLGDGMTPEAISDLLVRMAPHVGRFVARLFGVEGQREDQIRAIREEMETIFVFRAEVVMKVEKKFKGLTVDQWDLSRIDRQVEILQAHLANHLPTADPEKRMACAGAGVWTLRNHLELLAQDKPSTTPDADSRIAELRRSLTADATARMVFANALTNIDPMAFVTMLLQPIEKWSFAALTDISRRNRVKGWQSLN